MSACYALEGAVSGIASISATPGTAAIRGPSGARATVGPQGCPSSHHSFLGFISRLTVQRFANLSAFEYASEMSK